MLRDTLDEAFLVCGEALSDFGGGADGRGGRRCGRRRRNWAMIGAKRPGEIDRGVTARIHVCGKWLRGTRGKGERGE